MLNFLKYCLFAFLVVQIAFIFTPFWKYAPIMVSALVLFKIAYKMPDYALSLLVYLVCVLLAGDYLKDVFAGMEKMQPEKYTAKEHSLNVGIIVFMCEVVFLPVSYFAGKLLMILRGKGEKVYLAYKNSKQ